MYVCENNLYGEFTAGKDVTSVKDIADRARGHDMPGIIVNGNDVVEVYETTLQAVERARRGDGPSLIECKTYRWEGHVVGEEAFLGKAPIARQTRSQPGKNAVHSSISKESSRQMACSPKPNLTPSKPR